jgi:HK97 family phage prohead protease
MSIETRHFELDLEVRAEGDGRTVCGICVPYDREQRIHPGLTEVFRKGAFDAVTRAANRVKMLYQHKSDNPIGRATMLREDASGLYGEFRISKTEAGDEALELVRDGVLTNFSVGFQPLKDLRRKDGVVERVKAHLAEVSLVTFGAYGDAAAVAAVREVIEKPNLAQLENVLSKIRR